MSFKFNVPGMITGGLSILDRYFGDHKNPADAAMPYANRIGPESGAIFDKGINYLNPYMKAGGAELPGLTKEYGNMVNDPNSIWNKIGGQYSASPGFQAALKQALGGIGNAAAAGGMAGSPQHQFQAGSMATDMVNKDFYNYMSQVLGLHKEGLAGEQGIADTGFKAAMGAGELSSQKARAMAEALAAQADLAGEGQRYDNQKGSVFSDLAGLAGNIWGNR